MLGIVETIGGGSRIPQNVQHAGGACRLIEMRGPSRPQLSFTKVLYMAQRGQSVRVPTNNATLVICINTNTVAEQPLHLF
ncbi:hypothetical protein P171DRAFT_425813 [Karstenula rhodostoma CBS 690.94]|uniref:Uncharacterized protein n=1 Tax=Karstenula rhodostoma CBS 690.94 TaxID=1392251 RepID=A0A9P4UIL7_9PLEO|nr:hypothetical protein P171DRAFT_425813 [Karstenula rhodostoma CBS 690.94]